MIYKALQILVIGIPLVVGAYLLFAPGDKLVLSVKQVSSILPAPEKGTKSFKILVGFYRMLGALAWVFSGLVVLLSFIHTQ